MGASEMWAKIVGVVLVLIGILGFFMGGSVFGFDVNLMHNIVHLATGAIFLWAGFSSSAQMVNKWLGIVYIAVGIVGFFGVLAFLNVNMADNILHLVIGAISAWLGWKG